ncbi:MAG: hypothetical protein F7C09_01625 [Aeropyrum sp.]|nr:hypothetical protein [Aeropyrum sp.]
MLQAVQDLDLAKCRYLYLLNDDAPAGRGGHGRRAMSQEIVSESRAYIMIRHRLRAMGFTGFLFAAHACQVYHLVDITFRGWPCSNSSKPTPSSQPTSGC